MFNNRHIEKKSDFSHLLFTVFELRLCGLKQYTLDLLVQKMCTNQISVQETHFLDFSQHMRLLEL